MRGTDEDPDAIDTPLYNSRLIQTHVEYVNKFLPNIDIYKVLRYANINPYEVGDPAHWFRQRQVDRFAEALVAETGNSNISREVGRYSASSNATGIVKKYALGFLSPGAAYWALEKLASNFTRASTYKATRLGKHKVEVLVTPKSGVKEKPYQCDNRIGMIEAASKVFTKKFAKIEHPFCIHRGDNYCDYIITWERTPALGWRIVASYVAACSSLTSLIFFFLLSINDWINLTLGCAFLTIALISYAAHLERKDLIESIESEGSAAKALLEEVNIRYNNAIFLQEIGQAVSSILDIDTLIRTIIGAMEKRLDFDRGMIMTPDKDRTRLVYRRGYGYGPEMEDILKTTGFHLDNPRSRGPAVEAFKKRKPLLINDISAVEKDLSERSREFVNKMGSKAFICVPVVYKEESFGVIIVDNVQSKRLLSTSDVNLLTSVASQAAISINNATSFKRLQESEGKYRTILESIEEGYFEVDLQGNLTFFNDSVCQILGYSRYELVNMSYRVYTDLETGSKMFHVFNEIFRNKRPATIMDYKVKRKDGVTRILEMSAHLIQDQDDKPLGFRGLVRDVTERKEAEEMRRARLAAEAASDAKSRFLAHMSHEMRTPLNGIIGMTELAMMAAMDNHQRNILQTIQSESNSLLGIINDVLDFSKIEAEMLELEEISFDFTKLIGDVVNSFKHRAGQKGLQIRATVAQDVPVGIIGDPVRLRQVLTNLVGNAVKFTPKGEITIGVELAEDLGERVKVHFSVRDTGIGIPKEKIKSIFESFTQADSSTTRKYGGTGLGTTISKELVEMMGGEIGVESEVGVGSYFWFTAIFTWRPIEEVVQFKRETEELGEYNALIGLKKSSKVLLVEDYPTNQQVAMTHLRSAGYDVDLAENGLQALDLFKKNQYQLILMDIQMPVMDGYEATRQIRNLENQESRGRAEYILDDDQQSFHGATRQSSSAASPGSSAYRRVPIIAMTGHAVEGYRTECLSVGMDDYITKPLTKKHFLAMVDKWAGENADSEGPRLSLQHETQRGLGMPIESRPPNATNDNQQVVHTQLFEGSAPVDFERALKEFEGDEALLIEVLKGFVSNVTGQIGIIQEALTTRDSELARREAHSIKGGAANLRAEKLSNIAFELGSLVKLGDLERGVETLKKLQDELSNLNNFINILIKDHRA